jgi:hypothetical protein
VEATTSARLIPKSTRGTTGRDTFVTQCPISVP